MGFLNPLIQPLTVFAHHAILATKSPANEVCGVVIWGEDKQAAANVKSGAVRGMRRSDSQDLTSCSSDQSMGDKSRCFQG
jgi:hypothetical protein